MIITLILIIGILGYLILQGVVIKWRIPDTSEVSYDKSYIYRANSETGTYTEISSQLIADNTYFDINGDTTFWYKIRFYNSTNFGWSAYSDPLQGGTFYGYCTPDDVRSITNIVSSDLTDSQIYDVIQLATSELNSMINTKVVREYIDYIDEIRKNRRDGSNTTYYIRNWKGKYIGDSNNDGLVNTTDITVYVVYSNVTETEAVITSITPDSGSFVLDTAYGSGYKLYVSYEYANVSESLPSNLIKYAASLLSAAYCYAKINWGRAPNVAFGNIKIYRHMEAFDKFYNLYQRALLKINTNSGVGGGIGGDYSEGPVF